MSNKDTIKVATGPIVPPFHVVDPIPRPIAPTYFFESSDVFKPAKKPLVTASTPHDCSVSVKLQGPPRYKVRKDFKIGGPEKRKVLQISLALFKFAFIPIDIFIDTCGGAVETLYFVGAGIELDEMRVAELIAACLGLPEFEIADAAIEVSDALKVAKRFYDTLDTVLSGYMNATAVMDGIDPPEQPSEEELKEWDTISVKNNYTVRSVADLATVSYLYKATLKNSGAGVLDIPIFDLEMQQIRWAKPLNLKPESRTFLFQLANTTPVGTAIAAYYAWSAANSITIATASKVEFKWASVFRFDKDDAKEWKKAQVKGIMAELAFAFDKAKSEASATSLAGIFLTRQQLPDVLLKAVKVIRETIAGIKEHVSKLLEGEQYRLPPQVPPHERPHTGVLPGTYVSPDPIGG